MADGITKVTISSGDRSVEFDSPEEFDSHVKGAMDASTDGPRAAMQAALEICATCSHTAHDHDGPCTVVSPEFELPCSCAEFWAYREQREDRLRVVGHELAIAGTWPLRLNRRLPTEFWDSLKAGDVITVEVDLEVEGKGFKAERAEGVIVGLRETRKLRVSGVSLDGEPL